MYLSKEFLNKYKDKNPPFGGDGLGAFTALRTYSRRLPKQKRRETWHEICQRVTEYSLSLYSGFASFEELQKEAEFLFDSVFNLRVFPAGRTLFVGGTDAAKIHGLANFNCAFIVVDSLSAFYEAFHALMCGCGVGFRVLFEDVEKLPQINTNVVVANKPYHPKKKEERIEYTQIYEEDGAIYIIVGDSKQGWVKALEEYFKAIVRSDVESIMINYDSVRPKGEPLKTFGGYASGHRSLRDMFKNIHDIIRAGTQRLTTLQCMDIMNSIGYNVVVGGVRRTSQVCLFNHDDTSIMEAKVGLYTEGHANYKKSWRSMSNNSIVFQDKPSKQMLVDIFSRITASSEPGFMNLNAANKRRKNVKGSNPCMEILLDSRGTCNLSELNMMAFVDENGVIDIEGLYDHVRLLVRVGLRQTNINLELPEWDHIQKRDRLTGASRSGVMDFLDKTALPKEDFNALSEMMNIVANDEAFHYAKEMRIPAPLLVTTTKPSGTLSLLPTISPGIHRSFAPYYIRRVRISTADPLAKVMLDLGYPVYPENDQGPLPKDFDELSNFEKMKALDKANTWVIEFPVKSNTKTRAGDESALDQFQRYLDCQRYWTDHNTSITIYYKEEEVDQLIDMILDNWDDYVAVSFFPINKTIYPLLPLEEISYDEYIFRANTLKHIKVNDIVNLLTEYEKPFIEAELPEADLLDADCANGVCPIR